MQLTTVAPFHLFTLRLRCNTAAVGDLDAARGDAAWLIASPVACVLLCCCGFYCCCCFEFVVASDGPRALIPFPGVSDVQMFRHFIANACSCSTLLVPLFVTVLALIRSHKLLSREYTWCFAVKVGKADHVCSCIRIISNTVPEHL